VGVRIRVSAYIYFGANGPSYMGLVPSSYCDAASAASRGEDAGIGVRDQATIPVPTIPDGDNNPTN
jgi:hypothetical protein